MRPDDDAKVTSGCLSRRAGNENRKTVAGPAFTSIVSPVV